MKNTISILGVAILSASVSFDVLAVSLNQAIDSQLARPEGGLPCQRLLDAGGRVTGQLEVICARQAPAGSVPAAAGGGAANPSLGFVTESDDRRHDEHEAQEESINGAWSWFASVETGSMNRSTSEYEDGFDSDNTGFLVGLGYRIQDNLFLNVGLESRNQEGDFLEYGDFSQDSTGLRLGLNYNFNDRAFLDFALISDDVSASRTRLAQFQDLSQSGAVLLSSEGVASTDYDFTRSGFSLNLGYDYSSGAWRVTTLLGLDSTSSDFGSYSETGLSGVEVTVHDDSLDSVQSSIGVQTSYAHSLSWGVFLPFADLIVFQESQSKAREIEVSFVADANSSRFTYSTDALDSSFAELSVGGQFLFSNGRQGFFNIKQLLMHDLYESTTITAGFRIEL